MPTPVDARREPDLTALSSACASAVEHAVPGQLIVLTSTSYVGTTRDLLVEPLRARGFTVDEDVYVAFAPERIDPGNERHTPERTPRLVGGAGPRSSRAAADLLAPTASVVRTVADPETAEMAKLWENTYRAVNIALANELADAWPLPRPGAGPGDRGRGDQPYGFMPFYPGPGVGGHCIPCDPHYLLWQLDKVRQSAPLVATALARQQRPARADHRTRPRPAGGLRRPRARCPRPAGRRRLQGGRGRRPGESRRGVLPAPADPLEEELHQEPLLHRPLHVAPGTGSRRAVLRTRPVGDRGTGPGRTAPAVGALHLAGLLTLLYLGGVVLKGCVWGLAYRIDHPGDRAWRCRPLISLLSCCVLAWLLPYALLTLRRGVWSRSAA
ncbi:UDP-N-acetyl-D-mannosamine dehydrogenase [Streptomyces tendae]